MQMGQNPMADRDMMDDVLSSEKQIIGMFSTSATEAETPEIRECFKTILGETRTIQEEVFDEMKSRGWYQPTAAEQAKIDETRTKYEQSAMSI